MAIVTFCGRVVKDATVKTSNNGTQMCVFRVVEDRWNSQTKQNDQIFYGITSFNRSHIMKPENFKSGKTLFISGELSCQVYTSNEGVPQVGYNVTCNTINFVNTFNNNPEQQAPQGQGQPQMIGSAAPQQPQVNAYAPQQAQPQPNMVGYQQQQPQANTYAPQQAQPQPNMAGYQQQQPQVNAYAPQQAQPQPNIGGYQQQPQPNGFAPMGGNVVPREEDNQELPF